MESCRAFRYTSIWKLLLLKLLMTYLISPTLSSQRRPLGLIWIIRRLLATGFGGGTGFIQDTAQVYWRDGHPSSSAPCGYIRKASDYKLASFDCSLPDYVVCFIEGNLPNKTFAIFHCDHLNYIYIEQLIKGSLLETNLYLRVRIQTC